MINFLISTRSQKHRKGSACACPIRNDFFGITRHYFIIKSKIPHRRLQIYYRSRSFANVLCFMISKFTPSCSWRCHYIAFGKGNKDSIVLACSSVFYWRSCLGGHISTYIIWEENRCCISIILSDVFSLVVFHRDINVHTLISYIHRMADIDYIFVSSERNFFSCDLSCFYGVFF